MMFGRMKRLEQEVRSLRNEMWCSRNPCSKLGETVSILINNKKQKGIIIDVHFIPDNYHEPVSWFEFSERHMNHYQYSVLVKGEKYVRKSTGKL